VEFTHDEGTTDFNNFKVTRKCWEIILCVLFGWLASHTFTPVSSQFSQKSPKPHEWKGDTKNEFFLERFGKCNFPPKNGCIEKLIQYQQKVLINLKFLGQFLVSHPR
jgi:hypothetical protein